MPRLDELGWVPPPFERAAQPIVCATLNPINHRSTVYTFQNGHHSREVQAGVAPLLHGHLELVQTSDPAEVRAAGRATSNIRRRGLDPNFDDIHRKNALLDGRVAARMNGAVGAKTWVCSRPDTQAEAAATEGGSYAYREHLESRILSVTHDANPCF
jgi:hypothetical protein